MRRAIDRVSRTVATGLCFFTFGVGGLLTVLLMPLLWVTLRSPARRVSTARRIVSKFFGFFVGLMRFVGVITYEIRGKERLQRPGLLVMANHPTLIDVIFIVSMMPEACCVVRSGLAHKNPFTRGPLSMCNYILGDEGMALIEKCRDAFRAGSSIVLFPEGTRTPRSGDLVLRRGGANVAIRCRKSVTPVVIRVNPMTLGKGEKWYAVPHRTPHFVVAVEEDLEVEPYVASGEPEPIGVRRLNESLTSFFAKELSRAVS
jgi:1-acyl-sn-glycerol-3-phosphate acyltransferase